MHFRNIIGQEKIKTKLLKTVKENRVSHAQLFLGQKGSGKMAMAIAYAQYISCKNKQADDSCGVCSSCIKFNKLIHPDLHFIFPLANTPQIQNPTSKVYYNDWREYMQNCKNYPDLNEWFVKIGTENKQGIISTRDCLDLIHTISLKPYEAEYKIMIIWMVEKLFHSAAPKILKILEEPPEKTLFILISENQDNVINTILSRTQIVKIPKISDEDLSVYLNSNFDYPEDDIKNAVHLADGNYREVIRLIEDNEEEKYYYNLFRKWMQLCYKRDLIGLNEFVGKISKIGREKQKSFFRYALRVIRQCVLSNYGDEKLIRLIGDEHTFVKNFSPFINTNNSVTITSELNSSLYHIERNANPSVLFLHLSLKMHKLLTR